jgi:two-component system sensor histidine kinase/response regulator
MDDYLSKPFTQQQLGAVIGRWMALPLAAAPPQHDAQPAAPRALPALVAMVHHAEQRPVLPPEAREQIARDVINLHALDNIRALSAERGSALVQRVINAYVDDTPQHLRTLRKAIAGHDAGHLRKVAHSLKSSSANVGAETLAQMCKDMETLGRADSTEGASGILTDMEHEFQAVRHSLSAILEKET